MPKRIDNNQPEIVRMLREVGASVAHTHMVGKGFPDIVVGRSMPCPHCGSFFPQNKIFELKSNEGCRLTPDETIWHENWRGHKSVIWLPDQALRIIGVLP